MTAARLCACGLAAAALGVFALSTAPRTQAQDREARENAYRANNVGVAQLEQYNYDAAAASFEKALATDGSLHIARLNLAIAQLYAAKGEDALATARTAAERLPDLPQPHYVIGLAARALGRVEDAVPAFERVLEMDSTDAGGRINLGQLQLQERKYAEATTLFRAALESEPFNVTAAYGLALALTRSGATDEGRDAMKRFETLRDSGYAVTYSQTYLEQGRYGEAIASTGAEPGLVDPATPPVTFVDATEASLPPRWRVRPKPSYRTVGFNRPGSVTLVDVDGDGDLDAYAVDTFGQRLYLNEASGSARAFRDVTTARGLADGAADAAPGALIGDLDNDRRPDIVSLHPDGLRLFHQQASGRFEEVSGKAGIPRSPHGAASGALVDVDHDGDLDIFVAGDGTGSKASSDRLFRNNGNGTFADISGPAGLAGGATGIATAPTDFDNRRDIDLLVIGRSGAPRLYKNMRDGTFADVASQVGLPGAAEYTALAAGDFNKDGYTDFFFRRATAPGVLAQSDGRGRFTVTEGPGIPPARAAGELSSPRDGAARFLDYDNDGLLDLFVTTGPAIQLFRNLGDTWSDVSAAAGLPALAGGPAESIADVAFGDVDRDGDLDALVLRASGQLRYWRNDGGNKRRAFRVQLTGRVSNRIGIGAKVEIRAGSLRDRLETSAAVPAIAPADLLFGLGPRASADVVRVIWPSGILQAETAGDKGSAAITELDRKPSSCPYLFTWNGSRFEFVTDFMGGGEIGYWMEPGVWNTPDPDELVRIPPGSLVPRDGRYELRVTNELEEALFVDALRLVAIDHPSGTDVFPNEGLGAPRGEELTIVKDARPPARALDEHGHDVLRQIVALDRVHVDDFALERIRGYAAPHELRLDVGDAASGPVLLATGWTDYAFSSDNVAAHHRGLSLTPPELQARIASGAWRQVLANLGIPVGRPQTVVIDLRGKLRPGEREVRILTNMRIYWDRILVASSGGGDAARVTRLDPVRADLGWRGFSAEVSADGRQPFGYDYGRVSAESPWKVMIGRYTREGDVRELLTRTDDMFVIAKPGDEIKLTFDAGALPPLEPGRRRTFMLFTDGFSKEMDIGSATPYSVEPLPFHAMTRYPYGNGEHYPRSDAHRAYQDLYNTRVVSRPLPPLETSRKF